MRMYRVSADTSEKEKAIGGLLTMAQGAWLGAGVAVGLLTIFGLSKVMHPIAAAIIGLLLGGGIAIPFAFVKVKRLPLFQYLMLKREFRHKTGHLINTLRYGKDEV